LKVVDRKTPSSCGMTTGAVRIEDPLARGDPAALVDIASEAAREGGDR